VLAVGKTKKAVQKRTEKALADWQSAQRARLAL